MVRSTRLQRAFVNSPTIRTCFYDLMIAEGLPVYGNKRLLKSLFLDVIQRYSEPQLKSFLYRLLTCDISDKERAEAQRLLHMATTTLTTEQQARIKAALQ